MSNLKNVMVVESYNKTAFKEISSANVPEGMMMVEGVLGVVDVVNRNNRIYSRDEYVTHVKDLNQRIQESNGVLGELEHPKSMTINLNNISHKIMEVRVEENGNVFGRVLLLDTPKGKIAQSVVRSGSPLPISSRAQGQIQENGSVKLRHLSTYDLVGTAGFAQASLTESVEEDGKVVFESYIFDLDNNGTIVEEATSVNENSEVDYSVIESMIRRIVAENQTNIVEGEAKDNSDISDEIDEAMTKKYLPLIESWVTTEFAPTMATSVQQWVTEEFSPIIESWVTEEFAPVVESWITEEFAPVVESWITEEFAPVVESWVTTEFAPVVESWVTTEFAPVVESWVTTEFAPMITESFNGGTSVVVSTNVNEDNEELGAVAANAINSEFTKVDNESEIFKSQLLAKLDQTIDKAEEAHDEPARNTAVTTFVDESAFQHAPAWLKRCPQEFKHLWSQLNESQQDEVYRRAAIRIMETNEDVSAFWNSLNFSAIVENNNSAYKRNTVKDMLTESVNENANANPRNSVAAFAKQLKSNH